MLQAFRTRLVQGDPDRNWTYVWSRDGSLGTAYRLGAQAVDRQRLSASEDDSDPTYHGGFTLPQPTPPGPGKLDAGRGPELDVTVQAPRPKPPGTVFPGPGGAAALKAKLASGSLDITFVPGEYPWDQPVNLPANANLRMYGATVRRLPVNNLGTNWPAFVIAGPDVSVYGGTFVYDVSPGMVFLAIPPQDGLVVADCTFRRCNFGFYAKGCLVRDNLFVSAGAVIAPGGCWLRNRFVGPPTLHAFDYWTGSGPLCLIDNDFDGTDRGVVHNAANGPITDNLYLGTSLRNINRVPGGNELFTHEGAGSFDRHLILHTRWGNCNGAFCQWGGNADGSAKDNLVYDFAGDGMGVILWGTAATDNQFIQFELTGNAGIYCGSGATGNSFADGSIRGWRPSRGNQGWQNPSTLCLARTAAVWAEGPQAATNTLARVSVDTVPGFVPVRGFRDKGFMTA